MLVLDDSKLRDVLAQVLTQKGVPKLRHNSYISQVLQITTSAGYKKINGQTKWEVLQLIKVVESVGMKMSEFFEIYEEKEKEIHTAIWGDGGNDIECKISLYSEDSEAATDFSAIKVGDKWKVLPTNELKDELLSKAKRSVERIVIEPQLISNVKNKIALLDDDSAITDSLKEIISNRNYSVDTFDGLAALQKKVSKSPYDAYVLDWIIGDETCFELIKAIRASAKKNAMIIVLTGQLSGIKDDEISRAIQDYDIVGPFEKPMKAGVIKSNIDKYFAR
ncbi:helix-turn-helix domain-containing protein [Enterobacter ludwigii]|uniref:helix-turn-helix domain-containing protein n=1 Tax=Enterobacter ludwigii TaxID=299767 RepID=UPI003FD10248